MCCSEDFNPINRPSAAPVRLKAQIGARKTFANNSSGRATNNAKLSARSSANIFGISSPSTMCRKVITANAMMIARICATYAALPAGAIAFANGSSKLARVGSPTQPKASDASVTPSCVDEIKKLGSLISRTAARARRLPAAVRVSKRVRRTDTSANSAPTKNALAPTKNNTAKSFNKTLRRVFECGTSSAKKASKLLAGSSIS